MHHRLLRAGLLGAIAFVPALAAQTPANTLLIVADDVGIDGIGCYAAGAAPPPTPTIDALAARGVRFTQAIVCPTCSPTRASLLTGRHGFRTGIGMALGNNAPGLAGTETLLPELLGPAGVRTGLVGKWHLGTDLGAATPVAEGFAVFTGALGGALPSYFQWPKVENGTTSMSIAYATTDTVDEALQFVQQSGAQPWFLMLSFHAGHSPYQAPPAALHTQNLAGLDPNTTPIPFYKAMVQAMDTELGRLLATLPAATLANTNIVFLGDNGTASGVVEAPFDPARSKGTLYQGGVVVPLIAAGPAVLGAPRTEANLVHAVDLFATLAALQGVDARAAVPATTVLDAVSFAPLLTAAGQPAPRPFVYSQEFAGSTAMTVGGDAELIRDSRWTLLRTVRPNLTIREELYDLTVDPGQASNLLLAPLSSAAGAAYTALRRELARVRGYPWATSYGTGCSGASLAPTLAVLAASSPTIGSTFVLRVEGLSSAVSATLGAVGLDAASWHGTPLPLDLGAIGMTGCSLLLAPVSTEVLSSTAVTAVLAVPLPNSAAIVGLSLYAQAFPLVAGANPAGVLATNGVEAVIGS
ncbi:MAG: sulfatase-like hydrolase/transferase [Planctomycetes bacterium]|jgi:arylsulfatase A-like enzyme|nr:sulfatase-like hydrolase/transferase [Planctomycetota bacterium]